MSPRVLTCGESMVLMDASDDGPLAYGSSFRLRIAGAESNFAIALTRLGIETAWISVIGADEFGDFLCESLSREGVDLRYCRRSSDAPTGVFFKWRVPGGTRRTYYRAGSAATSLAAQDVPDDALAGRAWVHLSGITTGLSAHAREAVVDLAKRAHARCIPVSFDLNYRPPLWPNAAAARAAAEAVLPYATWLLLSEEEARQVLDLRGRSDIAALSASIPRLGIIVRAAGTDGAYAATDDGVVHVPVPQVLSRVRDEIGAGDAFAAGFVCGQLRGLTTPGAVTLAHSVAAHALRGTGDWETLPSATDLEHVLDTLTRGASALR